jgi:hypothetical protein
MIFKVLKQHFPPTFPYSFGPSLTLIEPKDEAEPS